MNTVLYHNHCMDGFVSAFLMHLFFKETKQEVQLLPVNYDEPIPDVNGKHVYIVDFSYPKETLLEASKVAKSITLLDHHLSAAEQFGGYGEYYLQHAECPIDIRIVEEHSGCGLVFKYLRELELASHPFEFLNNERLYEIVKHVEDRDLWRFRYAKTEVYHELLSMLPKDFQKWEEVVFNEDELTFKERYTRSLCYWELKCKLTDGYSNSYDLIRFNTDDIPIANVPGNFASSVGHELALEYPFSITYYIKDNKVKISLRSNKETGINVKEIAEIFGGGGHENSAGFIMSIEEFAKCLLSKKLQKSPTL